MIIYKIHSASTDSLELLVASLEQVLEVLVLSEMSEFLTLQNSLWTRKVGGDVRP